MKKASGEYKYIFIKSVKSGRTLAEAHSLARAAAVGLSDEYVDAKSKKNLMDLQGGLERITMTRGQAQQIMRVKFAPTQNRIQTRSEHLAQFLTGHKTTSRINWERDGNLIRKGPPNKPRPGSSKGVVGKTVVRGEDRVLKDLKRLHRELMKLEKAGKLKNRNALDAAAKAIKTQTTAAMKPPKS